MVLKHLVSKPAPALAEDIELLVIPLGGSVSGKLRWSEGTGVIEGRVVDSQGHGAAGIYADDHAFVEQAGKRTWLDGSSKRTDAQGFFRMEGLSPGVYDVMLDIDVGPTPFGSWPPQRRLSLEQGQISSSIDFQVEPAARYAGKLAPWPARDPTQPVLLEMTHAEFGLVAGVWLKEDGSFSCPPVFGATYVLIARQGERELGRATTTPAGSRELIVPLSN